MCGIPVFNFFSYFEKGLFLYLNFGILEKSKHFLRLLLVKDTFLEDLDSGCYLALGIA